LYFLYLEFYNKTRYNNHSVHPWLNSRNADNRNNRKKLSSLSPTWWQRRPLKLARCFNFRRLFRELTENKAGSDFGKTSVQVL